MGRAKHLYSPGVPPCQCIASSNRFWLPAPACWGVLYIYLDRGNNPSLFFLPILQLSYSYLLLPMPAGVCSTSTWTGPTTSAGPLASPSTCEGDGVHACGVGWRRAWVGAGWGYGVGVREAQQAAGASAGAGRPRPTPAQCAAARLTLAPIMPKLTALLPSAPPCHPA